MRKRRNEPAEHGCLRHVPVTSAFYFSSSGEVMQTGSRMSTKLLEAAWQVSQVNETLACAHEPPVAFEPTASRLLSGCSAN